MEILSLFALVGAIIVLGFIGILIFERTQVPDVIWLLTFGLLIGPIFGLVDVVVFSKITPLLAALALIIILFDGGLSMDLRKFIFHSPRGVLLATVGFVFSIAVVVLITYIAFEWPILQGILLGAIIGGTSSPIVISIISQLKAREEVSLVLSIESIFTDILCIVVAIASIEMLVARQATSLSLAAHSILSAFSIGAMVGLIGGIIWLYILNRIRGKPLSYMLSLAMLFFIYAGTEYVKGSGAIGALLFGLVLGNSKEISRMLRIKEELVIDDIIRKFEVEVSFFIRTFFFVYLGLIINIKDIISIGYGILLVIGVVALRPLAVRLSAIRSAFTKREIFLMSIMVPRGLAAAVLASLPLSYGYGAAKIFPELVFTVIVGTIIFCSVGVFLSRKIPEPTESLAILPSSKN